tara:strand:+ start:1637 stop:2140 length:504 start_codon:yes stop_codon:yes gene_type:complete
MWCWTDEEKTLLENWKRRATIYQTMHQFAEFRYRKMHLGFAIPTIVLSAVAGTTAFSSLSQCSNTMNWMVGVMGTLCTMLASMDSYFNPQRMINMHHQAYVGYGKLINRIRRILVSTNPPDCKTEIHNIGNEYDRLLEQSEALPLVCVQEWAKQWAPKNNTNIISVV